MIPQSLLAERPHLFSPATVTVTRADLDSMARTIAAIERVAALPGYQQRVLGWASGLASHRIPAQGVFFGYDFHLTRDGPKLIEINTNAGGALLAARQAADTAAEEAFIEMFRTEAQCRLDRVAIVDRDPSRQYLYPEFLLFRDLFESHGISAEICSPETLEIHRGQLWSGTGKVDLVYNRLTDFALAEPESAAVQRAWLESAAIVTPHPRAYALFADKRNLTVLSDRALLAEWTVDRETRETLLSAIPLTERVWSGQAEQLWQRRRELFFKPCQGYGSRAAYRGDKLTRRVFDEILAGGYVAQQLVPPSTVPVLLDTSTVELKADIRCYAYAGRMQLVCARLWQGQTTNFRTPGGGFARVVGV